MIGQVGTANFSGSFPSDGNVLAMLPQTKSSLLPTDGGNVTKLSTSYSPKASLGYAASDDTVSATTSTSPSQFYGLRVFVSNQSGTSVPVTIRTKITFRVRFFQPIANTGS